MCSAAASVCNLKCPFLICDFPERLKAAESHWVLMPKGSWLVMDFVDFSGSFAKRNTRRWMNQISEIKPQWPNHLTRLLFSASLWNGYISSRVSWVHVDYRPSTLHSLLRRSDQICVTAVFPCCPSHVVLISFVSNLSHEFMCDWKRCGAHNTLLIILCFLKSVSVIRHLKKVENQKNHQGCFFLFFKWL